MRAIFLFIRIFQLLLWYAVNFLFKVVQCLTWELTGVGAARRQAAEKPGSNVSAQVLNIQGKFKFCDYLMNASKWDFIVTHERFEPPEYVLQDHITLYAVTEKEAIFVEASPGVKVWNTDLHLSFLMPSQYYAAQKVIIMPIKSLHYLADKVGDPKGKLIFVSNCARCGSTLLTRMFEATERIVAFGEPNCLNFLAKLNDVQQEKKELSEEFDRLVISTIRILCKPTEAGKEIGYLVKLTSPTMTATPLLMRLFPNSRHIYMYRNSLKVAQSMYRMSCSLYSAKFVYYFGLNSATRLSACISAIGMSSSHYRKKLKHYLSIGFLNWSVMLKQYINYRRSGLDIAAVRYEDLVQNTKDAQSKILKYCQLPVELAGKASEAMKKDSQKGTPLSTEVLQRFPLLLCEGEAKIEGEKIMKEFGFPNIEEEYIADFTISHPKGEFS